MSFLPRKFQNFLDQPLSNFPSLWKDFEENWPDIPANLQGLEIYEDKNNFVVKANLPGFKSEEIDVHLDHGVLWIKAEKKTEETKPDRKYYSRTETTRSYRYTLPTPVDEKQQPDASFKDGVLNVTFNKIKGSEKKKINIKSS